MKSLLLFLCLALLFNTVKVSAQEEENNKQVPAPFEGILLLDNQTVIVPSAKTLVFDMTHRFGTIENGKSDLLGLYATGVNIRLGLSYSLKENLAIGVGYTKFEKFVDLNLKYNLLKQTQDNSTPISLTYFGNMVIDTRESAFFEISENETLHRLSSFNQFIIARHLNKQISLQLAPSFSYFNRVEIIGQNNYVIGLSIGGRYKISPQSAIIFDVTQRLTKQKKVADEGGELVDFERTPNIGIGWEIATSTHEFQIFITSFKGILPQYNLVFNENSFDKTGILIGFNMTRLWNF